MTDQAAINFIGTKLKELRQERGLSQEELAQRIGTQPPQLSRYENGKSKPSIPVAKKLADELGVTIDFFMPDTSAEADDELGALSEAEKTLILAYRRGDLKQLLSLLGK